MIFSKASGRTKTAVDNIALSLIAKGVSVVSTLLIVPLTIDYVNTTAYGIWLTLTSIVSWTTFFDLGLGNGLRNKCAEAMAAGDRDLARQYVSTTYFTLIGIVVILFGTISVINAHMEWATVLKVDASFNEELGIVFLILFFFFCMNMVANLVCTLLTADQKVGLASMIQGGGQFFSLVAIYILTKVSRGSLTNLALYFAGVPCLLTTLMSLVVYTTKRYRFFTPHIRHVKISLLKGILGLGLNFFLITLSMIFVFQILNIVIVREIGAEAVTEFNIAYKYFFVINMLISIIMNPFWSAFTDAYQKKDFIWMGQVTRQLEKLWLVSSVVLVLMYAVSGYVYSIWIGDKVEIATRLSMMVALYMMLNNLASVYLFLINGIGKIRLQAIIYIAFAIVSYPCMVMFGRLYGLVGILIVPMATVTMQAVFAKVQLRKILSKSASGIWFK